MKRLAATLLVLAAAIAGLALLTWRVGERLPQGAEAGTGGAVAVLALVAGGLGAVGGLLLRAGRED